MISFTRKNKKDTIRLNQEGEVPYFYFPLLQDTGLVHHGFSTRLGGVSSGEFASMNFNMTRGDDLSNVEENFRRFCRAVGCDWEKAILSHQTHTVNVQAVTEDMIKPGRTLMEKKPFTDVDGLITEVPEAVLVTSFADCVPLYFLDPVRHVIGLSHSGWRGTVNHMGEVTVNRMKETYGSRPEDILACIGPSICRDCYEVGPEVAEAFQTAFSGKEADQILQKNAAGKYQLDLWKANEQILLNAGISEEHIAVTNVCTCCNPELLFSHRYTKGRRGNLSAFLSLCGQDE
ncbi:MAG: peptidoglycan editing factor PgeF [Lachnospiraceae bacterium]|nr:peptidoglycan editing factor PgeF [Lachnospiraceae bacterium]MDY4971878.1 peptidoglycan editing factor PgeF [Lachnospiraceae bacterium]